jgi:DnaJ-class molecular chaperone
MRSIPHRGRVWAKSILKIEGKITRKKVRKAFTDLALIAHPDHGGTDEAMKQLIQARDILLGKP